MEEEECCLRRWCGGSSTWTDLKKCRKVYRGGRDYSELLTSVSLGWRDLFLFEEGLNLLWWKCWALEIGRLDSGKSQVRRSSPQACSVCSVGHSSGWCSVNVQAHRWQKGSQASRSACWGHRCVLRIALVFMWNDCFLLRSVETNNTYL